MNKQSKDYKARKKIGQFFTESKLAEKIIEGKQQFSDEQSGADAPQGFFQKIFGRKK